MKKSIYVEIIKIIKKRSFMVFTCLLILSTLMLTLFIKNESNDENVYYEKISYEEFSKNANQDYGKYEEKYNEYISLINDEELINEYVLLNNYNVRNDIINTLKVSYTVLVFLSIYIVVLGSGSIGFEYDKNTIKWIMLNSKRKTVLISKYISILIISIILMLLVYLTNIITTYFMYNVNLFNLSLLVANNGKIIEKSLLFVHTCEYLKLFFPQILLIILSMFFSFLFKNSTLSTAISIFLLLSGSLLTELFVKLKLKFITYTFLPYLDFSIFQNKISLILYNIESSVDITFKNGVIIIIVTSIILMIVSYFIFNRREFK